MESKKAAILQRIIEEYTKTAEPVGSKVLVDKYDLSVSPATVRNCMVALEEEGYLTHPHTSAGRIPTEKAYRYYVANCMNEKSLAQKERSRMHESIGGEEEDHDRMRMLARAVAELANAAVVVGFSPRDVYYTGLSFLFSQPEFAEIASVTTLSEILDHLDEVMGQAADSMEGDFAVSIGSENPFSDATSIILIRTEIQERPRLFGILGPQRMNYQRNIALAREVQTLMQEL